MFIWTAKLRRGRLVAGVVAVCALCGGIALVGGACSDQGDAIELKTTDQRVAYLEDFGWTVDAASEQVEELLIPDTFDATYDQYLALQQAQGFDLTRYQGKRIKRYTYTISNHPSGGGNVQAGLLLYGDTLVGGEVLSAELGGFIHGLERPTVTND